MTHTHRPPSRPATRRPTGPAPHDPRIDLALGTGLALLIVALCFPSPVVQLDVAVRDTVEARQPGWAVAAAHAFIHLGMPGLLAIAVTYLAICRAAWQHSIRPLLPVGAAWIVLGQLQQLQKLSDRTFPHWPDCPPSCPDTNVDATGAAFFGGSGQDAFPSGHSLATVVWFGIAVRLLPTLSRAWRAGIVIAPSALLFLGQTYLGHHWLSDSVGGIAVGVLTLRLLLRIPWTRMPLGPLRPLENLVAERGHRTRTDRKT